MMPATGTREAPRFIQLALDMISGLLPPFRVLDATFPAALFLLCGAEAEMCYFPENIPEGGEIFHARFRQDGGRRPVLPFSEALSVAMAPDARKIPLLALHGADGLALADALQHHDARPPLLLLQTDARHPALPVLQAAGYGGHGCFRLVQGDVAETFCFMSPQMNTTALLIHFDQVATTFAEDSRLAVKRGTIEPECVVARLPAAYKGWSSISFTPPSFVHDMARLPEGDAAYSWLWVAEQPHIRFLLGAVSGRFSRVRVILCNALSTQNLRGARLLLNGEVVPPRTEIWGETTGAVSAALPGLPGQSLILGLWLPHGQTTADGSARLFASIDRIELTV